jgi:hypothetical protein
MASEPKDFYEKDTPYYFCRYQRLKTAGKMEFPKEFILTSYNFFAWKEKMIMHL